MTNLTDFVTWWEVIRTIVDLLLVALGYKVGVRRALRDFYSGRRVGRREKD